MEKTYFGVFSWIEPHFKYIPVAVCIQADIVFHLQLISSLFVDVKNQDKSDNLAPNDWASQYNTNMIISISLSSLFLKA